MSNAKRGRGRPPKPEGERRGPNITFRTPGGLRTRLEQAAQGAGRSLSEEVVFRLERSFDLEDVSDAFTKFYRRQLKQDQMELVIRRYLEHEGIDKSFNTFNFRLATDSLLGETDNPSDRAELIIREDIEQRGIKGPVRMEEWAIQDRD